MDDNQCSDGAYEERAREQLRSLGRHIGVVFLMFLMYCAGWASAWIVWR